MDLCFTCPELRLLKLLMCLKSNFEISNIKYENSAGAVEIFKVSHCLCNSVSEVWVYWFRKHVMNQYTLKLKRWTCLASQWPKAWVTGYFFKGFHSLQLTWKWLIITNKIFYYHTMWCCFLFCLVLNFSRCRFNAVINYLFWVPIKEYLSKNSIGVLDLLADS